MSQNNLIEYDDPELYDLENDDFEPDGGFILSLAQELNGNILELGCGTGRITIPLAQAGLAITGLDILPKMLERAKSKAVHLPIEWVEADVRDFRLANRFKLIFESGATFQHLLNRSDQEKMLATVKEHLAADGRFLLSVVFPSPQMLQNEEEAEWFDYQHSAGHTIRVSGFQHYDPLSQIKTETAIRSWTTTDGQEVRKIAPLALRLCFPQEMESLLHYNGFEILSIYGDWDKSPLSSESPHLIYICKLKASL
jgi:SAM-dependent methyltransferase